MNRIKRLICEDCAKKRRYFHEAEREITEKNLRLLKTVSLSIAMLLLFFYAVTPIILPSWHITVQHLLFFPVVLLFYALAALYQKKGSGSGRAVTLLCVLFEAVLFVFVILIDVPSYPDAPSAFMPVLCIALPALFILPLQLTYSLVFFFEAVYIAAVYIIKTPAMAQYDIFDSVVGVTFSFAIAQVIIRLRLQDHELRMKYQKLSTQDFLSGILNKKACEEASRNYLLANNPTVTCMLLILDIDNFKDVNDNLGHYTGDFFLRSIGDLLSAAFHPEDIIGRFGGDEFMVLVKDVSNYAELEETCRSLQKQFLHIAESEFQQPVTFSIGAVLADRQAVDFESLFKQADEALYAAKGAGKNRYVLHRYQPLPH